MSPSAPYQPALLRILHVASAILTISALISGFWVYNTYDQRWGRLPLPQVIDIQGIHGTIALTFLLLLPIFALYSFHIGYRRLVQLQSFRQPKAVGGAAGWTLLHRMANTLMLVAVTFSVVTGRMMKEEWLPAGDLNRQWYLAHLVAWLCVFISLAFHILIGAKVGGIPLLASMFGWRRRAGDTPATWLQGIKLNHSDRVLKIIEIVG
jgi:hypothetical protein